MSQIKTFMMFHDLPGFFCTGKLQTPKKNPPCSDAAMHKGHSPMLRDDPSARSHELWLKKLIPREVVTQRHHIRFNN